jgi:hypothetical protein
MSGMSGVAAGAAAGAAGTGAPFLVQHEPPSPAEATGVDEIANEPPRTAEVINLSMIWFPFEFRPGFPAGWSIELTASSVRRSGRT